MGQASELWLSQEPDSDQARLRLLAIPPTGGGAAYFQPWQPYMAEWIDLLAVRLPGREKRFAESAYTEMGPLVRDLAEIVSAEIAAPYAVLGHCTGALIALELVRAIDARHGQPPDRLIVSAQAAPQLYAPPSGMHIWTLEELIGWLRGAGGTAPEVLDNLDLMRMIEPSVRADLRVVESYIHQDSRPVKVPISVLGGADDPDAPLGTLLAWRELTSANVELHVFPGDAGFFSGNPDDVATVIADDLRGSRAKGTGPRTGLHEVSGLPPPAGPGRSRSSRLGSTH